MTLNELSRKLRERSLSMSIHNIGDAEFVVWLFAADDPSLGVCCGEGSELEDALSEALEVWDGFNEDEASEEPETEPTN